jgi:hypothetical protein
MSSWLDYQQAVSAGQLLILFFSALSLGLGLGYAYGRMER